MNKNYRRENSNFNSKQFSATKNIKVIVMFIFFSVFLVGVVSSFEFDNVKNYDEETKTIEIRNSILGIPFLQLDKVAEVELKTPLNYQVPRGYQKVAEFEVKTFTDYNSAFKELELFDKNNGMSKFVREYDFKVLSYEDVRINDYVSVCSDVFNETTQNMSQICEQVVSGNHIEQKETWSELNSTNFKDNDTLTVGIFTNVEKGDVVEWIPNFFGVRINEWATWTENLFVELVLYYNADESSGQVVPDLQENFTGDFVNGLDSQWVDGILGNAIEFNGTIAYVNTTYNPNIGTGTNFSISFWVNSSDTGVGSDFMGARFGSVDWILISKTTGDVINFRTRDGAVNNDATCTTDIIDGTWHHVVVVREAGVEFRCYVDGISEANVSETNSLAIDLTTNPFLLGAHGNSGSPEAFYTGLIDEVGFWSRVLNQTEITDLFNGGLAITPPLPPIVTLNSPIDEFNTVNNTIDFNGTVTSPFGITNVSLFIDGILNETNSSGTNNTEYFFTKTIDNGNHNWTYESCNANGCTTATTRNLKIGFIENSQTFNSSSFETKLETFIINVTTNGNAPSSADLIYNGTNKGSATITDIGDDNFNISKTIDIPIGTGNNSWFFSTVVNSVTFNSSSNQQEISEINLTLCQASPQNVPYLNFTFTNETVAEESVTAEIDSDFNYWLGSGDILKSLTFSNTTENFNYTFCFSPANQTLNAEVNLSYDNSISQLRSFAQTYSLTNITTTQNLFLLPTADGIFVTFQVVDPAEQVISGVSANVTKEGNIISSGITDDAGLITYFLDPDTTYVFTFSKEGLTGVTTTLVPTQTSFTIIMGVVTTINQFDTTIGIDYTITPNNLTLVNGTDVNFSLDLTSVFFSLEEFGFVLKNSTGTIFNSTSSTTDTGGLLSQTLNTGSNTDITMEVFWTITGNQTNVTRIWLVFNLENEGFSVLTFFNDLSIYLTSGLFGLDAFGLGIIVFLIILISTGIVSVKFGITSPPGISIVVFSLVAFFDVALGIMPNPINAIPNFPTIFVGLIFLGILYSEVIR